ncbi:MAG: peptidoglycan bridge formation glycyltransferase FemA/FemB family protein [Bacilli bacterium]|nr:peptidoglycan bridge formation glycyltransferase FemA/FemB family protein [Bacilli bacterium]
MKIVELGQEEFDNLAKNHEYANPWQTSNFGKAAEALGYEVLYLGFEDGRAIKGCTLLLTKNVYLGQSISYAPRGILIDYEDYKLLEAALVELKEYLNNRKIMSFTMDPPVILSIKNYKGQLKEDSTGVDKKLDAILHGGDILKANQYAANIRELIMRKTKFEYRGENLYFEGILPRWYAFTNLPINAKTLLSKIDKRARNKLRKAAKLGIEILRDETQNVEYIYNIAKENFRRPIEYYKNFIENNPDCEIYLARINSEKYVNNSKVLYERELERNEALNRIIQEKNRSGKNMNRVLNQKMESDAIISAYKEHLVKSTQTLKDYPDGKVIAFCIVTKNGNNVSIFEDGYMKEHKDIPAIALLRWKILEHYSSSNFRTFNFGAITGNFNKKQNPLYGLNQSRLSLRGNVIEYIGEFGVMTNKTMYNLYQASVIDRHKFRI